jgi:hypothetical protein
VIIWGETDGLLLNRDRFVDISNVTHTLKLLAEGGSEAIEICRLARVTIWGETDGLVLSCDRLIVIGNVTQTLKPYLKGVSEVTEMLRLVRVVRRTDCVIASSRSAMSPRP